MSWQAKLVRWYRTHKRDLPWRRNPTPYRVLVSEFMLQQTTVKTVIPYYRRFLKRFPSLKTLAAAKEQDVLTAWSGLGYYSRARNLHRAARICRQDFGGRIPCDTETLQSLPGIGAYTAGAIASIAHQQRAAIVDGNVSRVLSRLFRIDADPKSPKGQRVFWQQAALCLPDRDFGDYNQALMELGATICTPSQPSCHLCPLQSSCSALSHREVSAFPKMLKKTVYRRVRLTTALIAKNNTYLMVQRPARGVLRDMWEFPMIEGDIEELQAAFGFVLGGGRAMPPIRHNIMNQRLTVTPWFFKADGSFRNKPPRSRWVETERLHELPTSSLMHKMAVQLR